MKLGKILLHPLVLGALALSTLFAVVYVWQEGWVLMPRPEHWWWHAAAALAVGVNLGQSLERWQHRRSLERSIAAMARDTESLKNSGVLS
jgi:hypothetical protein